MALNQEQKDYINSICHPDYPCNSDEEFHEFVTEQEDIYECERYQHRWYTDVVNVYQVGDRYFRASIIEFHGDEHPGDDLIDLEMDEMESYPVTKLAWKVKK